MVERKTTVEQGMRGRRAKALVQAAVAFAIIFGAFALDWNIGGLKEADRQVVKASAMEETAAAAEETVAVAAEQPEKDMAAVKKQLLGGCRNAQDFISVNILMQSVRDFENFGEILEGLRFANGEVQYPEVARNGPLLKELQVFFDRVDVFSEAELNNCVAVLERARQYNVARVSSNYVRLEETPKKEG